LAEVVKGCIFLILAYSYNKTIIDKSAIEYDVMAESHIDLA
jgi:hypothetical protein